MADRRGAAPSPTKRDLVARELRAMIAAGDLPRGARIHQDDLAARFATSITPVREALRQLEAEGLLVGEPHRGVRVSQTNVEEQLGVYVSRRLLEPFAARLATQRVSRRDLARARELAEAMRSAGERGDLATLREANRHFHFLIYERCEIPSLVAIVESNWAVFPWDTIEVLDPRAVRSVDEHAEILAALERGDAAGVGHQLEQHIARSYRDLVEHLTGTPPDEDPFDAVATPVP